VEARNWDVCFTILLNHLVGTEEERGRDNNAEGVGGLEADDELEFRRLLHRQIGRFRTIQKFGDLVGGERIEFLSCDAITCEASGLDHIAPLADRRDLGSEAQLSEVSPEAGEHRRRDNIDAFSAAGPQSLEGRF